MMYWDGWGWWPLMMLMMLLWIVLIAVIVWAIVRLVQRHDGGRGWYGRETPQEILDRRFASGEINAEEYRQARAHLSGREPRS